MDIEIRNMKVFNGIGFVAHSARVSGVGEIDCECGENKKCDKCNGSGKRNPSDEEIFNMIVDNDYSSALEHIVFTFEIWGLSKGNAPELLEHRISSHSGRSTRFVKETGFDYNIPPKIKPILDKHGITEKEYKDVINNDKDLNLNDEEDKKILKTYADSIRNSQTAYNMLVDVIGKESARYAAPFSMHTAYTYTINLRSLINMLGLRLCVRASPEFRDLMSKIYKAVRDKFPQINEIWCRGYNLGCCPENEVRDSPQGKECPFKNKDSDVFIPTKKDIRKGVSLKKFNKDKFRDIKESLLNKWSKY